MSHYFSTAGWKPTLLCFPARTASFAGCVHNVRVGFFSRCSGGNKIAAAAVLALAAVCSLGGCAPVYAKGAPLATPDLRKAETGNRKAERL